MVKKFFFGSKKMEIHQLVFVISGKCDNNLFKNDALLYVPFWNTSTHFKSNRSICVINFIIAYHFNKNNN